MPRPRLRSSWLNRRTHYWTGAIIAVPLMVIAATGILLQVKKHVPWIQPPEQRGTGNIPAIGLEQILAGVRSVPELGVESWDDVNRLDLRPGKGVVKVILENGWEAQVDLGTGAVLQTAYRRSDLIEQIHDGSFFAGDWTRFGVFLPVGAGLLLLAGSGLWMFWQPFGVRRRRARAQSASSEPPPRPR